MKATIYTRVSTEDQESEGTSLQSQLQFCQKKALELGYEVDEDHIISEVYSGLTLERPKLTELRELVRRKEIGAIIVYSTDRLSRDPVHLLLLVEECAKKEIDLCFVTEPLDNSMEGQLLGFVRGWASKLEVVRFLDRSMRGKRTRAENGRLPAGNGRKLYGYNYLPGKGTGEGVRYEDTKESGWVRKMYQWLVEEGLPVNTITRRLTALGVPAPAGGTFWYRHTVYRILTNPAYMGKTYAFTRKYVEPKRRLSSSTMRKKTGVVWKPREEWLEIPNATPPIISSEIFEAAQKTLKINKLLASRNAKCQYLLSGYIFCRRCGRRYQGYSKRWKTKNEERFYRYYRCAKSQAIVSPDHCDNPQLHAPSIEKAVWEQIELLLSNPELVLTEFQRKQEESSSINFLERDLETIRARLKYKEREKDRIHKAFYVTGNEERFRKDIAMLTEEVKALEEEEINQVNRIEANKQFALNVEGIKEACELVKSNLASLNYEEKRFVLKALQIKVMVDGKDINIEGAIPIQPQPIEKPVFP